MQESIIMTEDQEDGKRNLNSSDLGINRGFELMLRQDTEEEERKKIHIIFGKVLSLFKKEIGFHFEFYYDNKSK